MSRKVNVHDRWQQLFYRAPGGAGTFCARGVAEDLLLTQQVFWSFGAAAILFVIWRVFRNPKTPQSM
jgi:hypothetical protein